MKQIYFKEKENIKKEKKSLKKKTTVIEKNIKRNSSVEDLLSLSFKFGFGDIYNYGEKEIPSIIQKIYDKDIENKIKNDNKTNKNNYVKRWYESYFYEKTLFGIPTQKKLTYDDFFFVLNHFKKNKKIFKEPSGRDLRGSLSINKFFYFVLENKDKWIRKEPFKGSSKNNEKLILECFNHFFMKYPVSSNILLLLKDKPTATIDFIENPSWKKIIKSYYPNSYITNKQINKIDNFNSISNVDSFAKLLDEIYLSEIINNKRLYKEISALEMSDLLIEYAFYIKNTISKDPIFNSSQIRPLYDYIQYKKREVDRINRIENLNNSFHLKGHNLNNLYNEMIEWHNKLSKDKSKNDASWKPSVIKPYEIIKYKDEDEFKKDLVHNYSKTVIVELTTQKELYQEGKTLKHCVSSYVYSCVKGTCQIFSLRRKEYNQLSLKSVLTIEVKNERSIVQVRGSCNRLPTIDEKNIIKEWARIEGLQMVF